jgi:hypothetical protein
MTNGMTDDEAAAVIAAVLTLLSAGSSTPLTASARLGTTEVTWDELRWSSKRF